MFVTSVSLAVLAFVCGSVVYVYALRGEVRHASFTEYVRKCWPIFAPLNCVLYLFTTWRGRGALLDQADFPELSAIRENWQAIRAEGVKLLENGYFEQTTKAGAAASYDVGFRTFFKYGWSKFYLNWYGYTHESAKMLCPKTVEVLSRIPSVNGAMFSVLPPGGQLTRHADPIAVSLRYHLGLMTPGSDDCFLNVDGKQTSWRDGEAFLFDETHLHFAKNNTSSHRLILMCDVERPMSLPGRLFNRFYKLLVTATVVPNLEGDRRGLANATFATIAPLLARSKKLKETNRPAYLALKYTVNSALLGLVALGVVGLLYALRELVDAIA